MLFYYSFQFKHSYYAFTLIRKGAELGINYLVSTYILMYGLMKGIHQTQSSLSLMYLFVSAIVLIVLLIRWCRALDLTFRLRPLLIISLMLLSSCSKTSGPAEFVISITQSSYFGKLEPVVIKSSNLDEITLRIKESQNVSRGTVLYRDAYGRDVKASMDGRVEIRETVFLFISHAYECKVIIPETDMHNFRLKESYEIESMNGNPLGSIKLKSIDYQYEHNSGSYQDINQYLLIFDIKESKLIPQSVILTVPQPIISIPNSFVLLEEDAIYVETIEGKVAVKGTYNEETQTYDITTRLSDGLILYEVSND
ncbi:hypothetical protein [Erysipelothrix larvae]|nr:hypothetical protein [Erysipelothrix larvae]